eukprot:6477544-Amphidinium_carterae.1
MPWWLLEKGIWTRLQPTPHISLLLIASYNVHLGKIGFRLSLEGLCVCFRKHMDRGVRIDVRDVPSRDCADVCATNVSRVGDFPETCSRLPSVGTQYLDKCLANTIQAKMITF